MTTTTKPAISAAVVTTIETSAASAPPLYPGTYDPAQPQAAPAPYPQASYFLYPTGDQATPLPAQAAPQPYPDLNEKPPPGQVELQQYPAQPDPGQTADPAYPPPGVAPYPTAGDRPQAKNY